MVGQRELPFASPKIHNLKVFSFNRFAKFLTNISENILWPIKTWKKWKLLTKETCQRWIAMVRESNEEIIGLTDDNNGDSRGDFWCCIG